MAHAPRSSAKRLEPTSRPMASRKSSASVAATGSKSDDAAGAARRVQQRLLVRRRDERHVAVLAAHVEARGSGPAGRRTLHLDAPEPLRGTARAQLRDRAARDEPAVLDDRDGVAEALDELELVAGEQDRHAGLAGPGDEDLAHDVDADGIQAAERLVEDERDRVVDERRGELHPLLVPQRELLHAVVCAVRHADLLHPVARRAWTRTPRRRRAAARSRRAAPRRASWGTARAPPACSRTCARMASSMGLPSHRTAPASADRTPRTMRIAVVLPAPFGPTKPNTWPGETENVSPSRATTSP